MKTTDEDKEKIFDYPARDKISEYNYVDQCIFRVSKYKDEVFKTKIEEAENRYRTELGMTKQRLDEQKKEMKKDILLLKLFDTENEKPNFDDIHSKHRWSRKRCWFRSG